MNKKQIFIGVLGSMIYTMIIGVLSIIFDNEIMRNIMVASIELPLIYMLLDILK